MRHRRFPAVAVVAAVLVLAALVAVGLSVVRQPTDGVPLTFRQAAFGPQIGREAEWAGSPSHGLSGAGLKNAADNVTYELIPKFADGYNISKHFAMAKELAAQATKDHRKVKILEYFSASFWYLPNVDGWKPWSDGFNTSWYMKDSAGNPVAFYGDGHSAAKGGKPVGYMLDLTNPDYRAWAIHTIVSWMHQAPYSGVVFDSADEIIGASIRPAVSGGTDSYAALFCGGAANDASCSRVTAWDQGMQELISQTRAALKPLGDEVAYNGIAPSTRRIGGRNLELLPSADIATNENFCFTAPPGPGTKTTYTSITDDAAIMKSAAHQGKKIIEITNWAVNSKLSLGDYCLGGFLMGWQPGLDYFAFHRGYADALSGKFPENPDIDLELGNPTSTDYQSHGSLLTRTFQHGYVAVNTGSSSTTFSVPASAVQFADGRPTQLYSAGDTVTVGPHAAALLLFDSYLYQP